VAAAETTRSTTVGALHRRISTGTDTVGADTSLDLLWAVKRNEKAESVARQSEIAMLLLPSIGAVLGRFIRLT